jgi:hypothetical protein
MVPLSFTMAERGVALDVELADETFRPLLGELRIASPLLASKVEDAAISHDPVIELEEREIEFLATAATVLLKGGLIDDPELRVLAEL